MARKKKEEPEVVEDVAEEPVEEATEEVVEEAPVEEVAEPEPEVVEEEVVEEPAPEIIELTCDKCDATVSGPDEDAVKATMTRHKKSVHGLL